MAENYSIKKLTDCKWANLYDVEYCRKADCKKHWIMCSRKDKPIVDAALADAVVIIPILKCDDGLKIVLTKEFRIPIWDYEYGFPAGLIDKGQTVEQTIRRELKEETGLDVVGVCHISSPVYSTAGLSDESCCMAIVEAEGQLSTEFLHSDEDIEPIACNSQEIKQILESGTKVAAKAWGILYYFANTGKVDFA